MISSVLQLFPSIFKYSFMVNFDFFLLEPIVRFIYSCLFCFLWLGLGGGGYCHLYGLYGYVLLWGIWMGKWIGRVMHACKLSQIPIQCHCCLIMGLFFSLSLTTRVWKGWGSLSCPPASHTIFITFSLPCAPHGFGGRGRHMTFQTRVLSFVSKVHSLKQDWKLLQKLINLRCRLTLITDILY